ncbi:uncharacterized protein LOC122622166 [Drosophila teissieri]|uniref:uncharacterized protein LOC122622166 n=1 Tax=Drosophila teissieri TaxID=7243 RepID=UPI001CBA531A|nr:uncharacterized protein LOC122622166 [Drosophila teissieri]
MSSSFLAIFILLALRTADLVSSPTGLTETHLESSEAGTPVANKTDPPYITNKDPKVISFESTSNTKGLEKGPKERGRQKRFIRNPNYVRANEFFDKGFGNDFVWKRFKDLPPPHPGFGEKTTVTLNI